MKLQLNDSARTIITSINTEVARKGDWNEADGYIYVININGMSLKYTGVTSQKTSQKDLNKLIKKGAEEVYKPFYSEQEEQHWQAVAADCANPDLHGHTVCTTLAGKGSSRLVWDFYKQKAVPVEELTK